MTIRKEKAPPKKKASPPKKARQKGKKPGTTTRLARDL
jgi:hypothetical protein